MDKQEILQDCKKFIKMAGTTLINQNAMIMATSDDKGYDLEKYKKKVIEDMEKEVNDGQANKCNTQNINSSLSNEPSKLFEELMYGTDFLI